MQWLLNAASTRAGGQVVVARLCGHARLHHPLPAPQAPNTPLLRHFPTHCQGVHGASSSTLFSFFLFFLLLLSFSKLSFSVFLCLFPHSFSLTFFMFFISSVFLPLLSLSLSLSLSLHLYPHLDPSPPPSPSSLDKAHEESIRDQPDGRVDSQGRHTVLRLCAGEAEGALPQHPLFQGAYLEGVGWSWCVYG